MNNKFINFGGTKGTISPIENIGSKELIFKWDDSSITFLQIGSVIYGYKG